MLNDSVVDSVVNSNFKILAEQVASNIAASQNRMLVLAEKSLGTTLQAMDASSGLATTVASLGSVVADLQQFVKAAGNTPPVTP